MPKRVMDEAIWGSDRLAKVPEWMRPLYAWLHPLADAYGIFEMNSRVIHGKVTPNLPRLTLPKLEEVLAKFQEVGLLFVWEASGKRFAYWTGSEKKGRLPSRSHREFERNCGVRVPGKALNQWLKSLSYPPEGHSSLPRGQPRGTQEYTSPNTQHGLGLGFGRASASALARERASGSNGTPPASEELWKLLVRVANSGSAGRMTAEKSWPGGVPLLTDRQWESFDALGGWDAIQTDQKPWLLRIQMLKALESAKGNA